MKTVTLRKAKAQLSTLVSEAAAGEEIVITRFGKPVARLISLARKEPREPGLAAGRVTETFFEPLPDDELKPWGT